MTDQVTNPETLYKVFVYTALSGWIEAATGYTHESAMDVVKDYGPVVYALMPIIIIDAIAPVPLQARFEAIAMLTLGLNPGLFAIRADGFGYLNKHLDWMWTEFQKYQMKEFKW
jgi:hypothetical protein